MTREYEAVIGLEVHVELATRTKMFCGCATDFGGDPNTRTCPVCLGQPGSLPVPNGRAVEYAIRLGLALGCDVAASSLFHRKNYFYPDMPKNFQISQYDEPVCVDGWLEVPGADDGTGTTTVGIERAHLEEDTGKTVHVGGGGRIHEADHSLVDYNRAGVPLMEIVSVWGVNKDIDFVNQPGGRRINAPLRFARDRCDVDLQELFERQRLEILDLSARLIGRRGKHRRRPGDAQNQNTQRCAHDVNPSPI